MEPTLMISPPTIFSVEDDDAIDKIMCMRSYIIFNTWKSIVMVS